MSSLHSDALEALRVGPGAKRPRRLRRTETLRDLVRETTLNRDEVKAGDSVDVSGTTTDDQVQADKVTLR